MKFNMYDGRLTVYLLSRVWSEHFCRVLAGSLSLSPKQQHLADPNEPSRSYRRQESYESSISSCASLSLSFKGDPSQWGNPIGEAKASATQETAAAVAAAVPREDAPKPVVLDKEEPMETGLSAAAAMAGLGRPAQYRNREEAAAASAGATAPGQGAGKSFLVQFPVLSQDAPSSALTSARRASCRSFRSSETLGSLSLSQSFSSEDLDYELDFTQRDEEDSESDGRGPVGVSITPLQQVCNCHAHGV